MKAPRTYRAERLKELAYLARFLGPVEFVRQVATRYRIEAAYSERRNVGGPRPDPAPLMFQGVPGSHVALPAPTREPEAPDEQSRALMDLVASQAITIKKLQAELADARQILFLAHEALLQRNAHKLHGSVSGTPFSTPAKESGRGCQ